MSADVELHRKDGKELADFVHQTYTERLKSLRIHTQRSL